MLVRVIKKAKKKPIEKNCAVCLLEERNDGNVFDSIDENVTYQLAVKFNHIIDLREHRERMLPVKICGTCNATLEAIAAMEVAIKRTRHRGADWVATHEPGEIYCGGGVNNNSDLNIVKETLNWRYSTSTLPAPEQSSPPPPHHDASLDVALLMDIDIKGEQPDLLND